MSRFKAIESYQAQAGRPYRLLPFNLTNLDSASYVLTNMAGEFHLLSSENLRAFVHHQLPSDSLEYVDLWTCPDSVDSISS